MSVRLNAHVTNHNYNYNSCLIPSPFFVHLLLVLIILISNYIATYVLYFGIEVDYMCDMYHAFALYHMFIHENASVYPLFFVSYPQL